LQNNFSDLQNIFSDLQKVFFSDFVNILGLSLTGFRRKQTLTLADCWSKQHVTKYFFPICIICFRICEYFSGFSDNSWICKLVWDLQNNICGFNNFIEICKSFSDLINSSTLISEKHYDLNSFSDFKNVFSDFVNILGLFLIGFRTFPLVFLRCREYTRVVKDVCFIIHKKAF